jgi:hypothetical protein
MRLTALFIAGLESVSMLLIIGNGIFSRSDAATKGLDEAAAIAAAAILVLFLMPALLLAWRRRLPFLALVLALAPIVATAAIVAWAIAS